MSRRLSLSHRYRLHWTNSPNRGQFLTSGDRKNLLESQTILFFSRIVPKEQRALLISVRVLQHRSLKGNRRFKIMFYFYKERHCLWVVVFFGKKCAFPNTFSANIAYSVVPWTALRWTINYRFLTSFHVKSL